MAAAGSFVKGFATAFKEGMDRKAAEAHDINQLTLKYRLDGLTASRDEYKKKQEQEDAWAAQARQLGTMTGDADFSTEAYNMLRNGYTIQQIQSMWDEGRFQKTAATSTTVEAPNPEMTANQLNIKKTEALPAGIGSEKVANTVAMAETSTATSKAAGTFPAKPMTEDEQRLSQADEKIRQIDPSLLDVPTEVKRDPTLSATSKFKYLAPTKKFEMPELDEIMYLKEEAIQKGDKAAEIKYANMERVKRTANAITAADKAREEGKDIVSMAVIDKGSNILKKVVPVRIDPVTGKMKNAETNEEVLLSGSEKFVHMNETKEKDLMDTDEKVGKDAEDYNFVSSNAAESFDIGARAMKILQDPANAAIGSTVTKIAAGVDDWSRELSSLQSIMDNQETKAQKAYESGDLETLSSEVANYEQSFKAFVGSVQGNNGNILSDKNLQLVANKALLENYQRLLAYKMAMSDGSSLGKVSNQDFNQYLKMTGYGEKDNKRAARILADNLAILQVRTDNMRTDLNDKLSVFEKRNGFRPGTYGRRLDEKIPSAEGKELLKNIVNMSNNAKAYTAEEGRKAAAEEINRSRDKFGKIIGAVYPAPGGKFVKYQGTPEGENIGPESFVDATQEEYNSWLKQYQQVK